MAHLHNKAGQFCKTQAMKRVQRIFFYTSGIVAIAAGFCVYLVLHRTSWPCIALGLLVVGVMRYGGKHLEKPLDTIAKERIRYLRGGRAEALVAWLLSDLEDDWHVFNNVMPAEDTDWDHIVVGPGGIFCLSTKSFRGLFTVEPDGRIFYNNGPTSLITDTRARAAELKKRLTAVMGADVQFVEAVLAVPFCYVDFQNPQCNAWVLHKEDLVSTIESRPKKLAKEQIARLVKAVEMLASHASDVYQRPALSAK
jgi:hypothetical protein